MILGRSCICSIIFDRISGPFLKCEWETLYTECYGRTKYRIVQQILVLLHEILSHVRY